MKLSILTYITLVIIFCCCLLDAKKKKINLFGKKHHGKKKSSTTTKTTTPIIRNAVASKVSKLASFKSAHPSATRSVIPSAAIAAANVAKKIRQRKFHNKTNLKLVYKSVLPIGMKRPADNVIFEYTDNEEGKTCRCICRMK